MIEMNSAVEDGRREQLHSVEPRAAGVVCRECGSELVPDIIYGGMRYYVCRPCGVWAVPYPPIVPGRPG